MIGEEKTLRVLVVEDEPLLGPMSVRILETLGEMEAFLAVDGVSGLQEAREKQPDLILLDLVLPGMSGVELLRHYRQEGGTAKVLVVTETPLMKAGELVFGLGADFLLSKPVNWTELPGLIRSLTEGTEGKCRSFLLRLGAGERGLGLRQTAECAALLGKQETMLLKEIYGEVAGRNRTSPENVAKNVERLAAEIHRKQTAIYREVTGRTEKDPRLTNREFLELIVRNVRIPL